MGRALHLQYAYIYTCIIIMTIIYFADSMVLIYDIVGRVLDIVTSMTKMAGNVSIYTEL